MFIVYDIDDQTYLTGQYAAAPHERDADMDLWNKDRGKAIDFETLSGAEDAIRACDNDAILRDRLVVLVNDPNEIIRRALATLGAAIATGKWDLAKIAHAEFSEWLSEGHVSLPAPKDGAT